MRIRTGALVLAAVLGAAACGGAAAPTGEDTVASPSSAPAPTAAPEEIAGIPADIVAGAAARMEGTVLERLPHEEVALDVLDGCAAAAAGPEAFDDGMGAVVGNRMDQAGEPLDGEAAARYDEALRAAMTGVCPAELAAAAQAPAAAGAGGEAEGGEFDEALDALGGGVEGTLFEGMLDGPWPPEEAAAMLQEVCRIAAEGGSNAEIADLVSGEALARYDAGRGDLDALVITVATVAVAHLCPEHSVAVLGP
ncbi:MAG: hypothetical protein KQH83_03125 [Actinobacteria bacterium]|nr:hypothetical protein [Actinomycetota bacterium]